ncbi:MAG: hypothetical protein A3E84_03265 [Gammaproteobacteria bacterium RIFCSPHIGHO2_12_FULL_42_13]|nr:MAG: hypothetical protein A3E84_03265 [Gammaproteobacteria bacterium RIFCSPHIGHO2_12_FULL_42_13]
MISNNWFFLLGLLSFGFYGVVASSTDFNSVCSTDIGDPTADPAQLCIDAKNTIGEKEWVAQNLTCNAFQNVYSFPLIVGTIENPQLMLFPYLSGCIVAPKQSGDSITYNIENVDFYSSDEILTIGTFDVKNDTVVTCMQPGEGDEADTCTQKPWGD